MMMRMFCRIMLVAGILMGWAATAAAFEINPLKNKYHGNRPPGGFWEQISETVHEDITDAAVRCAAGAEVGGVAPFSCFDEGGPVARNARGNKYNALIRGVWWNDDPNQHLFGIHYPTWVIWMDDAKGIATKGRNWLGSRTAIGPGYKMQYRSHYGDMQFLHAMANSDGETAPVVQERILAWIQFAYAVAIEDIDSQTELGEIDLPAGAFFERQSGWSVHYLFAPKFTLGTASVRDVALGSILHVVQDSFSHAHTARSFASSTACPAGRILEFHAYGSQDSDRHSSADTRAQWLAESEDRPDYSAVQASAQMLIFARDRANWQATVRPWLVEQLFCVDADARVASSGEYGKRPKA